MDYPEGRGDIYEVEDRGNRYSGSRYCIWFDDGTIALASTKAVAIGKIKTYLKAKVAA